MRGMRAEFEVPSHIELRKISDIAMSEANISLWLKVGRSGNCT